jgi:hypothetical protein
MMARRHPDKDIRKALALARDAGWSFEAGRGHRFGTLSCGEGCDLAVWSTPRNPTTHAKRIRETLERCPHETNARNPAR